MNHHFMFSSDEWLGEGLIHLSMSQEPLAFMTRWKKHALKDSDSIEVVQEVQIKGMNEVMINQFTFENFASKDMRVVLENSNIGRVEGVVISTENLIGWEFKDMQIPFQGFEFYEQQNPQEYLMRAEYSSGDDASTLITGKIWKKTDEKIS
jgi:hypothetical protein